MRPAQVVTLCLLIFGFTTADAQPQTVLECTFDSKTVDQLIGEGGAAAGEPISLGGVGAIVRSGPFPTPCLEMTEDWGFGARAVRFEFLDNVEFSHYPNLVVFSFNLYFQDLNGFNIYLRERSFSASSFLNMTFTSDGSILAQDLNDGVNAQVGSYTTGVIIPIEIAIRLIYGGSEFGTTAGVLDLSIGGETVMQGNTMGIIRGTGCIGCPGIGSILIGLDHDADSLGTFFLDDLLVTLTELTPVEPTTWGEIKASAGHAALAPQK